MIKERISQSLSLQLFAGVLISLALATCAFCTLLISSNELLDYTVYSDPFMKKIADKKMESLKTYVNDNDITADNLSQLTQWYNRGKNFYLAIYQEDHLIYNTPLPKDWEDDPYFDMDLEDEGRSYQLTLADGTQTQAFLYNVVSDAFFYWSLVISALLSFVIFSLCFISLVRKKLESIKTLKNELDILSGGDLQHEVPPMGQDELGELAYGINEMRRSILEHQAVETEIRSSNSKLVTAMSHDLRTPLTSLLGYLELLDRGKYEDAEQMKHFVHRSLGQALRIKTMADQLFEYFLVYSTETEKPNLEQADADAMFQQILGEYAFSLESQDYAVTTDIQNLTGQVAVNLEMIRRVFDNIYSNLLKYADKAAPISLCCSTDAQRIEVTITNTISPTRDERESTNIGLNTCRRIMQYHNGDFEAEETNHHFKVTLHFPLVIYDI